MHEIRTGAATDQQRTRVSCRTRKWTASPASSEIYLPSCRHCDIYCSMCWCKLVDDVRRYELFWSFIRSSTSSFGSPSYALLPAERRTDRTVSARSKKVFLSACHHLATCRCTSQTARARRTPPSSFIARCSFASIRFSNQTPLRTRHVHVCTLTFSTITELRPANKPANLVSRQLYCRLVVHAHQQLIDGVYHILNQSFERKHMFLLEMLPRCVIPEQVWRFWTCYGSVNTTHSIQRDRVFAPSTRSQKRQQLLAISFPLRIAHE